MFKNDARNDALGWDDEDAVLVGRDDVSDFNEENILPQSPEVLEAIRNWLQPTSYDAPNGEFRKHLASYLPGTGEWLLSSPTFREWHDNDEQGVLWIKGIPGSGKSVFAASLIDHLSKEGVPVLYFFFRQIIDANHTPDALLRDWLAQVLIYSPPLQALLKEYVNNHRSLDSVSMATMWQDVKAAMVYLPKVYCVVDALDEMDNNCDGFLKALAEFGRWRPSRVKVILTSRPVPKVERPLRQDPILQIRLDEYHVDQDIASYVAHRLHRTSKSLSSQNKDIIKHAVPGRANGLFLYAKLAMDAFLEQSADVEDVLKTLPLDLNVMYTNLLHEHAKRSGVPQHLQLLILSFVTDASRPLRLIEIVDMIRVVDKKQTGAMSNIDGIKELVRAACGPLLEILPDETVCVIHHSLTEFLNGSTRSQESPESSSEPTAYPILNMDSTHNRLAMCCISYLVCGCLDEVKLPDDDDYQTDSEWGDRYYQMPAVNRNLPLNYPFLAYSLDNWHVHARKADASGPLSEELYNSISNLLSGDTLEALTVLSENGGSAKSSLHTTAKFGLSQYVARLIETKNPDVNSAHTGDETPIFLAATGGHAGVVKVLLANGAKPDEPSQRNGKKPLHVAASNDHGEVVELLLAAGVDPLTLKTLPDPGIMCGDPEKTVGHTPLMYAMQYESESAVKAFLPYLRDPETVNRALAWAAGAGERGKGCRKVIDAILLHPLVDVNALVRGETALYIAASRLHFESAISLLKAGADPTILSSSQGDEFGRRARRARKSRVENRTPLHALCRTAGMSSLSVAHEEPEHLLECVSLMVKSGVDVNAKDKKGETALSHTTNTWPGLVRALIKAGADVNTDQHTHGTPLHGCINPEIVKILVEEANIDINTRRVSDGMTPLLSVAARCSTALIRQYIDLGADPTATNYDGQGLLHLRAALIRNPRHDTSREDIVDGLLEMDVPVNSRDGQGMTVLHYLDGLWTDNDVVLRLVAAGADLNVRDKQGRTPMFYYVRNMSSGPGLEKVILRLDQLVDLGARLDLVDYQGSNLLFPPILSHHAAPQREDLIKELIKRGLDPKNQDYEGNTLFHEAVAQGSSHLPLVLRLGIDPDQQNHAGQSALHFMLAPSEQPSTEDFNLFRNMDIEDYDGIRPLHVASRSCEIYVHTLLSAGASPTKPTLEGITPLHVAARFRKPGTVGLLLEAIEGQLGKVGLAEHLNTFHKPATPTALHLACRSGVPETVALLLAAGADPNATSSEVGPPLEWCVQYEAENTLWEAARAQVNDEKGCHGLVSLSVYPRRFGLTPKESTYGIKIDDLQRQVSSDKGMTTRLEEILDMLCAHGADLITPGKNEAPHNVDKAIRKCKRGDDYTMECLVRLRKRLEEENGCLAPRKDNFEDKILSVEKIELGTYVSSLIQDQWPSLTVAHKLATSVYRRAATREAFADTESWTGHYLAESSFKSNEALIESLLKEHDWDSVKKLARRGQGLLEIEDGCKILSKLVEHGVDSIVREVVTREEVQQLQAERKEALRLAKADGSLSDRLLKFHPLLDACKRPSGNMPMLRCLVEELGVDVNDDGYYSWPSHRHDATEYNQDNCALNECCRGECWWQVAEGLPYLIKKGANLERRDFFGRTALLWALGICYSQYRVRVVRTLIEAGADVNAVDYGGKNCLSHAGSDVEITSLLLKHGAVGSTEALASAIDHSNVTIAKALLDSGMDPNAYHVPADNQPVTRYSWHSAKKSELPPVFFAAMHQAVASYHISDKRQLEDHFKIIRLLLTHGADPFVTFVKRYEPEHSDFMEKVSALHQILYQGGMSQPFLDMANLDLEHRDPKGRTLLLSACRSRQNPDLPSCSVHYLRRERDVAKAEASRESDKYNPTIVEILLQKGACATARDDEKRNALHHLIKVPHFNRPKSHYFEKPSYFSGHKSMQLLLLKAPELLHQTDAAGETPLHYALRRGPPHRSEGLDTTTINILLMAGANPHQLDANGDSALHHLAKWLSLDGSSHGELSKLRETFDHFVSLGIPINGRNKRGETPLFSFLRHEADYSYTTELKAQEAEALEILAKAGADFFAVNDAGENLLHLVAGMDRKDWGDNACRHWFDTVMVDRFERLVARGLDPMAEDGKSRTSLDIAAAKENNEILALFERPAQ